MKKRLFYLFLYIFSTNCYGNYHVDVEEAVEIALANNQTRVVSQEQLAIAEAQYKQALSAYWPSLDLNASWQRRDEDATFTLDEFSATTVTPLGAISIDIPETEVTLFERDVSTYSLNLVYPIYTGGKREAIRDLAKAGVNISQEEVIRTENQIRFDVKRFYQAVILTSLLHQITDETHAALSVSRDITKAFYDGGSASVDRRDLLQSEMALATIEKTRENIKANYQSAIAALRFTMGLMWDEKLTFKNIGFKNRELTPEIANLITQAKHTNSDVATLEISIEAAEAGIRDAKSGHLPKFAFVASATSFQNTFDKGLVNDQNENTWSIGVQMQIPLFRGFRVMNEVSAAQHKKNELSAQKILVDKAVSSKIHHHLIELERARKMAEIGNRSSVFAVEHTSLSSQAYRNNIIETKELIESYIYELIIKSQEVTAQHDTELNLAHLEYLIGKEIINNY